MAGTNRDAPAPAPAADRTIAPMLLRWYDRRRRDLPWRRQASPYRTLVSEFMLQQTVVAAVIPFFERFVARLPDVRALAAASEDEVLALWSGLGYYARARNLHRAARAVAAAHDGEIPGDETALRHLPGIGPYTAAAVAAIAFGRHAFALDGNAARVVARLAAVTAPIDKPGTRERLRAIGLGWVPRKRPGDFAQAVMELGATVCAPRVPRCGDCPLATACVARRTNQASLIPNKAKRSAKRVVRVASVRLRRDGHVLLVRRQTGLLAGTWMLPAAVVEQQHPQAGQVGLAKDAQATIQSVLRDLGVASARLTAVGAVRHLFTHRDVTVEVFDAAPGRAFQTDLGKARATGLAASSGFDQRWIDEQQLAEGYAGAAGTPDVAVSSFLRKQLALKRDKSSKPP